MLLANSPQSSGNHDGLVVAAELALDLGGVRNGKGPERADNTGATELVVELGAANGCLLHDVDGTCVVARPANVNLPWHLVIRNVQVGYPETTETGLGH